MVTAPLDVVRWRTKRAVAACSLLLLSAAAAAPRTLSGAGAGSCGSAATVSALVQLSGFKNGLGSVRLYAYGPDAATFLRKGKWLRRVDVPLEGRRSVKVCIALPATGKYAFAARHDANGNKQSDWHDGAGFSRNPRLSLSSRPAFAATSVSVGPGRTTITILLNYRRGLTVGPVS